ncbi:autotransporter outer membrane beta-barrel domain-containing protein [Fusobacterium ulcerans]|uniref:autotransporter outer membrane beta-barrel domain-containing protein n=1 Tax=Fusobacterium ulcerans TaxID=861 RepID=UPI0036F355B2
MIEKIMKAVKSGNKKRGRNITVGAVVGILLSCTVAMGADVIGLEIKNDGGIKFIGKEGEFTPREGNDPYPNNEWNIEKNIYTNNSTISGKTTTTGNDGIGLKLSDDLGENFIFENNGAITGNGSSSYFDYSSGSGSGEGYGIDISNLTGNITNNGAIIGNGSSSYFDYSSGYSSGSGKGYGIYISSFLTGSITNDGAITGNGSSSYFDYSSGSGSGEGYGIYYIGSSLTGDITNNGRIKGNGSFSVSDYGSGYSSGYGIDIDLSLRGDITNNGAITGNASVSGYNFISGSGYGIDINSLIGNITNNGVITGYGSGSSLSCGIKISTLEGSLTNNGAITSSGSSLSCGIYISSSLTRDLANNGVIYGSTNAIKIVGGTVNSAVNYGILVADGSKAVEGLDGKLTNYGLIINNEVIENSNFVIAEKEYTVIVGYDKGIPITRKMTVKNITDNSSFNENKTDSILNALTDTYKVTNGNNKVANSIINAYKRAVVMEGDSNLTLENTIVNGGNSKDTATINLDGNENVLTIQKDSIINTKDDGIAILVTGDNNFLTIKGDSIVNGDIKATGDMNTLNLYGKQNMTRSSESKSKSMKILHNIDGFGRIQIENNVTFFEEAKVTGVERLNINKGGTLNLRLKAGEKSGDKATHALSVENTGLLIAGKEEEGSENAGTLNFITNGMGTGAVIGMEGIELENVFLRANSILYDLEVVDTEDVGVAAVGDIKLDVGASLADIYNERAITFDSYPKYKVIPNEVLYTSLNKIYQSSVKTSNNVNAITDMIASASDEEQWEKLLTFLGGVYIENPYSYSSELSRRSIGMFRDIITENEFRPNLNNWLIMGGFTHTDGGTKDTYYGKNYYKIDGGTSTTDADMKLTGAYMLAKYGYSENTSLGLTLGGNKSEAKMDIAKVKGNNGYLGAFTENYRGNLTLKAGAGVQYSEYDAERSALGGHSYSDKYSDMTYDIYLNGRYSHNIGDNLFLEPYTTLSYTYVDQDGANEGSKALAIETDSKSFGYTVAKVGVDLKKVIPHSTGKSTLTAGASYTKILDGAEEEFITGRFKGGSDFDILVAHKNEHSIGLNAKYALELENGVLFDVKGTYSIERDSHNQSGKNRTKGEWIVGAGIGYKF